MEESHKKYVIGFGIAAVFIVIFLVWAWKDAGHKSSSSESSLPSSEGIVYYYGAECPHCKKVQEFLDREKVAERVSFEKKEVWHNRKNAQEMRRVAEEKCGLNPQRIGVPFLYAHGECIIGEPQVIQFFQQEMKGGEMQKSEKMLQQEQSSEQGQEQEMEQTQ